ncbi:MAG: RIP metalloprotease RseP [Candidatus Wolfebacteria bacterium]|nr:RIP metalloprotease RseP [Candidatus Wolfebacteria bacterium]
MFLSIILVILFLSALVLVHELGHFLAAKKFGLFVEEFGIGLPPRLWGKKIGETIYSINWLLIGGFVKIFGEDGDGESKEDNQKIEIISSKSREVIDLETGQMEINSEFSDVVMNRPNPRSFISLPAWKRAIILVAGVVMNFIFGWFLISLIFMVGIPQSLVISVVSPGSPAASAGLEANDQIIPAESAQNFIDFINSQKGKEITLKINRGGEAKDVKIIPRINPPQGEGALGVGLVEAGIAKQPILASFWEGFKSSWEIIKMIFVSVSGLITGIFAGRTDFNSVTGPVGIAKITNQAAGMGFIYLIQLLALISLNLSVINILPFPALDGGRLFFLLIEKIKGTPLPVKFEKYANGLGMALLILLMVAITLKDIFGILR